MEPISHQGPVTGISFVPGIKYLLAGNGPSVQIYDFETGELVCSRQIFAKNKIHGIVVKDTKSKSEDIGVLFYGGRSICLCTLADLLDKTREIFETGCNDWIISAEFSFSSINAFYILTAHNIVMEVRSEEKGQYLVGFQKNCNEKSILYSGSFKVISDEKVLVFAGTVMSGIFVWDLKECKILHHLTGHEGSIFGVKGNKSGQLAVSCSDDRSIKVWDLKTGENIATGWGHGARIWYLEFFNEAANLSSFQILSCSEDCTARIWQYSQGKLICEKVVEAHSGKNVWTGAINHEKLIAATGGNDGKVRLLSLTKDPQSMHEFKLSQFYEVLSSNGLHLKKNETFKAIVSHASFPQFMVISSYGRMYKISQNLTNITLVQTQHDSYMESKFINNYFTISQEYWPELHTFVVCFTNSLGESLLITLNEEFEVLKSNVLTVPFECKSKITNSFSKKIPKTEKFMVIYETPHPKDNFCIVTYDLVSLQVVNMMLLQKPDSQFVVTSFDVDYENDWLIMSSRYATITIYELKENQEPILPLTTWKKILPGDTISQIKFLQNEEYSNTEPIVSLVLRDGTYVFLKLSRNERASNIETIVQGFENLHQTNSNTRVALEIIGKNRVSKGGFLEGLHNLDGNRTLYGFRSDHFYVYNETKNYEIWTEPCGGSHRLWKLEYNESTFPKAFRFFYMKSDALVLTQFGSSPLSSFTKDVVAQGTHGREIRGIDVSPNVFTEKNNDSGFKMLMTGSEDTTVKFSKLYANGAVKACSTQRLHVSGLQSVKFLTNQYAVSTAAREEFHIWKITNTDSKEIFIHNYDSSTPSVSNDNPDLRIMDFDSLPVYSGAELSGFVFVAVYSNSFIRVFHYDLVSKSFTDLYKTYYKTICILCVSFFKLDNKVYFVIGTTDGFLTFYSSGLEQFFNIGDSLTLRSLPHNVSGLKPPTLSVQIHQNGVKAMSVLERESMESIQIVTGGDDNGLALFEFPSGDIKSFIPNAASSTITSVSNISNSQVLVTSVDQVLRKWSITEDGKLKLDESHYTTIADTGCSVVTNLENELFGAIGGVGQSVWRLSKVHDA